MTAAADPGARVGHFGKSSTFLRAVEGSADLVMDFTDPIIRGTSLFHCHLLNHEDKGMMAKVVFR